MSCELFGTSAVSLTLGSPSFCLVSHFLDFRAEVLVVKDRQACGSYVLCHVVQGFRRINTLPLMQHYGIPMRIWMLVHQFLGLQQLEKVHHLLLVRFIFIGKDQHLFVPISGKGHHF